MVVAGISHWLNPVPFLQHLPPWVPAAEALILATGVLEVLLGLALLPESMSTAYPGGWYPWLRLPFQILFVAWTL